MFFFGHAGITAGAVQAISHASGRKIDLRKALFFGLLPDLVDKPVALGLVSVFQNHTRLFGHSFLAAALVLLALRLRRAKHLWILWGAMLGHFFLDRLWINDSYALFWPFLGPLPELDIPILEKWHMAFFHPWTIFGETTGLLILGFLTLHYRLYRRKNFKLFLDTGELVERV